jgi:hypothetical protein
MFVYTIELYITFIITPIIISAIEGYTKNKLISVHEVIFCFGITRYSIFGIFCFWFEILLFHVTYLNSLSMSEMSLTLLFPTEDVVVGVTLPPPPSPPPRCQQAAAVAAVLPQPLPWLCDRRSESLSLNIDLIFVGECVSVSLQITLGVLFSIVQVS